MHIFEAAGVLTFASDKKFVLLPASRTGEQSSDPLLRNPLRGHYDTGHYQST